MSGGSMNYLYLMVQDACVPPDGRCLRDCGRP